MSDKPLLIVEDDEDNAHVVRVALKRAGYEIVNVGSAEEGLSYLSSGQAARGVLVDLRLPEMDGLEMIRVLRSQHDYDDLPLIGMTAFHTPELRTKAMADGLNGYFPKPLDLPEFVKAIKAMFP